MPTQNFLLAYTYLLQRAKQLLEHNLHMEKVYITKHVKFPLKMSSKLFASNFEKIKQNINFDYVICLFDLAEIFFKFNHKPFISSIELS